MARLSTKLLCAVASAAIFATPAAAQRVDRIVAFGDSYADDGNFFQLTGIPRPAVYGNGRFSNGTNFVDTMGQILNAPIDNFAIGGAFTGPGNTGFTNINGPGIPGFPTETAAFLAGGGPAAFPRVSGTFDANDLVVVSVGGNDARFYEMALGRNPTQAQIAARIAGAPAAAAISVGEATTGLNALVGAGARNITYVFGDPGNLPEVRGSAIAPIGTAFANSFTTGIQASLANLASQGVIVNYLDLTQLAGVVEGNLAAFGLQSAGACPIACVTTNPELLDRFLFYVDQVHLTSRGFAIVGQYAVRQLEAPLHFAGQTDLGVAAASGFGQLMGGRLDLAGEGERPLSFFLLGTAAGYDVRGDATTLAYDYDSTGIAGGAEYDFGPGVVGVALSYSRPRTDIVMGTGRTRADAYQAGVYAGFASGGLFAEGYAGVGRLDYRIRRTAVIDEIAADTDGDTIVAGGEAGYLFGVGGVRAGPVVGVQYARAKLDGYTERGDPVLTLTVGDQRASEFVGFAGLEANFETEIGGLGAAPFVKLLAEKELDSSRRAIRYAGVASPVIVNRFDIEQGKDDVYARIEGGASLLLGAGIALQLQASATVEHPRQDEFSGFVGLKFGF